MMRYGLSGILALAFVVVGCSRSAPSKSGESVNSSSTVAKIHWLGKKRLATDKSATNFMAIWKLPESAKLEAQTLDKLSTAPWRLWKTAPPLSNAPAALLRPLLDDLVREESYLEVRAAPKQPGELVLAIRLDAARAALWQKNLATVLESCTGGRVDRSAGGVGFNLPLSAGNLTLARAGDWTLVAVNAGKGAKAAGSGLLADFTARIQRGKVPFAASTTNYWLEAQADLPRLSETLALGWKLPQTFPLLALRITGDGKNVRTYGDLNFPQPLPATLDPWRLPLQLTAEPLTGLTVARSFTPILERMGILSPDQVKQFPGQFLLWLRAGPPLQLFFAFPTDDARREFRRIAPPIKDWVDGHADARRFGAIVVNPDSCELAWQGLAFCSPYLRVGTNGQTEYLTGGFGLTPPHIQLPKELHEYVSKGTNLVYFDWEFAADTLPQWRYLDDVSRMIFDGAHASRLRAGRNSMNWMLKNMTNLSHSVTELRQLNPKQLEVTRKSTLGLSSVELDILFNWIEMDDFPRGLSTLWKTNPAPFKIFHHTNSPANRVRSK